MTAHEKRQHTRSEKTKSRVWKVCFVQFKQRYTPLKGMLLFSVPTEPFLILFQIFSSPFLKQTGKLAATGIKFLLYWTVLVFISWVFLQSSISDKTHETDAEFVNSLYLNLSMLRCPFYLPKMAKHPYDTQLPTLYWGEEEGGGTSCQTDCKHRIYVKYLLSHWVR